MPVNALVLGGGAPNYTLMTGALLAFEEAGLHFDVVTGAGGGGAVALNYVAPPKGMDRVEALKNTVNLGISDAIYKRLPMNYKVFMKGGKMADAYRTLLSKLPGYKRIVDQSNMTQRQKLISDLIQLGWAITTPGILTPWSKGLCAHAPFIEAMTDFDKLKTAPEDIYIDAYDLTNHKLRCFGKDEISFETFGASLSYPFIYPPTDVGTATYIEGATDNAFNFNGVELFMQKTGKKVDNIVILNAFGNEDYLVPPKGLWSAFGQLIVAPLVPLDRANYENFKLKLAKWNEAHPERTFRTLTLDFPIPKGWAPTALDWSSSNLERLFALGRAEGHVFFNRHRAELTGS